MERARPTPDQIDEFEDLLAKFRAASRADRLATSDRQQLSVAGLVHPLLRITVPQLS